MRISDWSSDVCSSDLLRKIADAESRAPVHRHVGDVVAIQGDPAVVGRNEAGDDIEAGGLSRAVGTEQADRLSALQGQSHTAQNRPLLEALADVVDRQTGVIGYQAWPALRCRRVRVLGGAVRSEAHTSEIQH